MFKKLLSFDLFSQVEQRVITSFKQKISSRKEKIIQRSIGTIIFMTLIPFFSSFFIDFTFDLNHFSFFHWIKFSLFLSLPITGLLLLYFGIQDYIILNKAEKNSFQYGDDIYQQLASNAFFNHGYDRLTESEIQQLFSSELHSRQIEYLENKVVYGAKLTLTHLKELNELMDEKTIEDTFIAMEKNKAEKLTQLDAFFEKYHIDKNTNHQLFKDHITYSSWQYETSHALFSKEQHKKEKTLSSLL